MSGKYGRVSAWVAVWLVFALLVAGTWWIQPSRAPRHRTIAFVPQTAGAMLWEVEHFGANAARKN